MQFDLEIDLVDAFRHHLDLFLPDDAKVGLCKTEKSIKWKWHTDLMLADFDGELDPVDRKNLPKLTRWLQAQLARAAQKPILPEKLCSGFIPRTQARRLKQIASLVRWGFMTQDSSGAVQTAARIRNQLPTRTVAFEAKLTDWKRAVEQAKNYRRFTHSSWVVMPESFRVHDDLITLCVESKVGLAVFGIGGVEKVVDAPIAVDSIPRRTMRFELLVDYARYGRSDRWFFVE